MHNGFRCEDRSVPASDAAGKLDIRVRVPGRGAALGDQRIVRMSMSDLEVEPAEDQAGTMPVGKAQRQAQHSGRWPLSPNLRRNVRIATAQAQELPSASLLVIT